MEFNISKQCSFDFKNILIDEIALEGLEGIDIDLLWRRVESRISTPITEKMKRRYWEFIASSPSISFYKLPHPVPYLEIKDRFKIIDEDSGHLKDPDDYLDGPYEYTPVENEFGSCVEYNNRKLIKDVSSLSYEEVIMTYNHTLVLVASKEERWKALAPHVAPSVTAALNSVHYCLLELIGRSRENGQMTIGKTNLLKLVKDSKMLFYHRKFLKTLDMIRVTRVTQKIGDRGVKSLLLRLRRFHKSMTMSLPKIGPIRDLVELLQTQENFSEVLDNVFKKGILTQHRNKKFQKTYSVFQFFEKEEEVETKKKKLPMKRRYISISTKSDSSSGSEDESNAPALKCQYKVGISLPRQAYMMLHECGLKGLTQVELAQLLGTEFYTCRNICKMLKSKGLVKEVYEDKGRQRIARLVVTSSTVNNINVGYEEEWGKFLNYRDQYKLKQNCKEEIDTEEPTTSTDDCQRYHKFLNNDIDWSDVITDIKKIDGLDGYDLNNISLLSSKKNLTLRQLKYANGIIKVLGEKLAVAGYQGLNTIVSAEVGEPQMDTRALKVFIQKLLTDGFVKVFKLKWPDQHKYTIYVCSANVTSNHPCLKEKYFEILDKIHVAKATNMTKQISQGEGNRSLARYAIPRYSKVRKFHEFIFKMAYCDDLRQDSKFPEGFNYLSDAIQEMTVEFALGNVNMFGKINLTSSQVHETLNVKIKDLPEEISREILYASTFRNTLRENLRVLAFFGLVQIINQPLALNFDSIIYYVNKHAKLVNTTGVWPRPDADIKKLENEFYLGNIEDVCNFWNAVIQISSNTTISMEKRELSQIKPPVRMMNEVQNYDNGTRLGDGNGPCGFDSSFHLEVPRLWRLTMLKGVKAFLKPVPKTVKIPKLQRNRKPRPQKKNKRILAQENFRERMQELNKFKIPVARGKKHFVSETESWSKLEDLIIILCKVAFTIMGPISQPGSLRLKNMVAKEILSVKDPGKSPKVCHFRAIFLDSKNTWAYEKQRLINEFKKRRALYKKYEGLLKKIKSRNITNLTKFLNEAKLPMMELIWILIQITKSESFIKRTPCIATNFDNFHDNFTIGEIPDNKPHKLYNVPNATDYETILKESIMLTVAMSYNREVPVNIAKKIYALFKVYPEMTLRKCIEELRKCHAISAREKICNNKMYKINLQDLVESSYKLSAGYYRKWICKLNAEFLDSVAEVFNLELPVDDVKGSSGVNCFCCELHTEGLLELSTSSPPSLVGITDSFIPEESLSVIDIESKCKLKSGTNLVKSKTTTKSFSFTISKLEDYVHQVSGNANVTYSKGNLEQYEQDNIVCFLNDKQEKGSTFSELLEFTKADSNSLIQRLKDLESQHIIKRVGFYDNRIVHIEYAKYWAMTLDKKTFLPAPWITLYGTLRHEIFFRWANVLMSRIFEYPGCSITYLSETCELISAKSVQVICDFLLQCECITMKVVTSQKVDLFSEDEELQELTDYNPYESPSNILVFPSNTVLTRYASIKRQVTQQHTCD